MSRQRAYARQARQVEATARAEKARRHTVRASERSLRRRNRRQWWRLFRLWHNTPGSGRNRERWAALIVAVLVVLLLTYLFTSSLAAVGLMILVTVIATPALIAVVSERSSS